MNINGDEGPKLKYIFTCENCKYLGKSVLGKLGKFENRCFFYKNEDNKLINLMDGNIGIEKITPDFCPFLIKKMRIEKLKELYK